MSVAKKMRLIGLGVLGTAVFLALRAWGGRRGEGLSRGPYRNVARLLGDPANREVADPEGAYLYMETPAYGNACIWKRLRQVAETSEIGSYASYLRGQELF